MSTTARYRITKGSIGRYEGGENIIYKKGDAIELDSQGYLAHKFQVEPWPENVPKESELMDWSFVQSQTVPEVLEVVKGLDDTDSLSALLESEKSGANRIGVRKGVEERIKELS